MHRRMNSWKCSLLCHTINKNNAIQTNFYHCDKRLLSSSVESPNQNQSKWFYVKNSLVNSKVKYEINKDNLLTFYVCGPTVYAEAHIGHCRTAVLFDAMQACLSQLLNVQVVSVMNITDVDDKIIKKCKENENNVPPSVFTKKMEDLFWLDMASLGVQKPLVIPRATDFIQEMKDYVKVLLDKDLAYVDGEDESIYFNVKRAIHQYPGKLGGGNRSIDENSDFALWKTTRESFMSWSSSPQWKTNNNRNGRPGWHLECSTMIHHTCGQVRSGEKGKVDIHGGGVDLKFPHHANEKCQSDAFLGGGSENADDWAKCFIHTGHVTLQHEKMSKSVGNFLTLKQVLGTFELTPRQLRLLFLSTTLYSSPLEWNEALVKQAKLLDEKIFTFINQKQTEANGRKENISTDDAALLTQCGRIKNEMEEALLNDFNFPQCFILISELISLANTSNNNNKAVLPSILRETRKIIAQKLEVLGFCNALSYVINNGRQGKDEEKLNNDDISNKRGELDVLIDFRNKVRSIALESKDKQVKSELFRLCDEYRSILSTEFKVNVEDGNKSTKYSYKQIK